jgi:hypothetical protein
MRSLVGRLALLAAVCGTMQLAACGDIPTGVPSSHGPLQANHLPACDQIVEGQIGPGALYQMVRPANWNGGLFLHAHGYTSPDEPVALPAEGALLISLLAPQGFAVAFSSFSENGTAIKDGTQRTHQLLGLFTSKFGPPGRVYVGGASLGGLIAIKLTELYPAIYAGSLPVCAVAGGIASQYEYDAHARALFDYVYPGVLPGSAAFLPAGTDIPSEIISPAFAAISSNPFPALSLAFIDQTPFPGANPAEVIESIVSALAGNAMTLAELRSLTRDRPYFDNSNTTILAACFPER